MPSVLIIHEVADSAADIRKEPGERSYHFLKYENDANRIVHSSRRAWLEAAKHLFEWVIGIR